MATGDLKISKLQRWSPDFPKLYQVNIKTQCDEVTEMIGFRNVEVKGTKVHLNGKPVFCVVFLSTKKYHNVWEEPALKVTPKCSFLRQEL